MYNNKRFLAIITARGGSKRLKNKNIKDLNGKPLISYTIQAAKESNIFDKIIVSTDSLEIADVSKKYGAEVPFIRPQQLASDNSKSMDVILHAIQYMERLNEKFDYIMLLQPTSPLRSCLDIMNSISMLFENQANAIVSVSKVEHSPSWTNYIPDNLLMDNFFEKNVSSHLKLDKCYELNGSIYLAQKNYLVEHKDWYYNNCYAYVMPRERSIDIDNRLDFEFAEFLVKKLEK